MSLYIQKVPTIVSLSQMLEDEDTPGQFCSPENPILECDARTLPTILYPFTEGSNPKRDRSFGALALNDLPSHIARASLHATSPVNPDASDESLSDSDSTAGSVPSDCVATATGSAATDRSHSGSGSGSEEPATLAEKVLVREWDRREDDGLFRYNVRECSTKVTDGVYAFVAQLNEGRATKKRATEFRVDQVCQPFDAAKFNFQKAAMKEVLFQFTAGAVHTTRYHSAGTCGPSPNLVLINVSPIEYGHVLLVPRVNDCIPQVVDQTSMLFALQCANEVHNPCFRLGYNSLGAFGTINHLHFQGYFLNRAYPAERAPTVPIAGLPDKVRGVRIERLAAYPVHGWVFSGCDNLDSLASSVGAACMRLQALDVPHNLLICDSGNRVLLWPQHFAERQARGEVPADVLDMGVNPAAFEIAGHIVLKRPEDYEGLTQARAWELLQHVSLTDEDMDDLQAKLFASYMKC